MCSVIDEKWNLQCPKLKGVTGRKFCVIPATSHWVYTNFSYIHDVIIDTLDVVGILDVILKMIHSYRFYWVFRTWQISFAFFAPWWRHQMETFSALLAICAGNSPVPGEFPTKRPVTRSFDVLFDLRLNKRLSKQWWGWWFETLSRPWWRHRNDNTTRESTSSLTTCLCLVPSHFQQMKMVKYESFHCAFQIFRIYCR